jgi:hypothetical protein
MSRPFTKFKRNKDIYGTEYTFYRDTVSLQVIDVKKKLDPNCTERNEIQVSSVRPSNQTEPTSILPIKISTKQRATQYRDAMTSGTQPTHSDQFSHDSTEGTVSLNSFAQRHKPEH